MKKTFVALALALAVAAPVSADLPDTYTSNDPEELNQIDVDAMTEEELKTAYNELRKTYGIVWDLYMEQLMKSSTGSLNDEDSTVTPVPASDSIWKIKYYIDEFQEPTDDAYISTIEPLEGSFSNSATTNSPLFVWFVIDDDNVGIKLVEYSDSVVKGYYRKGHPFNITIQYDGQKEQMTGTLYDGGDRVCVDDEYSDSFREALRTGKEIKLYLKNTTDSSSYLFTVPATNGFAELYDQIF